MPSQACQFLTKFSQIYWLKKMLPKIATGDGSSLAGNPAFNAISCKQLGLNPLQDETEN